MSRLVISFDPVNNEKIFVVKNFLTLVLNYNNDSIELLTIKSKRKLKFRLNERIFSLYFSIEGSGMLLQIRSSNSFSETENEYQTLINVSNSVFNALKKELQKFHQNILKKRYEKSKQLSVCLLESWPYGTYYKILLLNDQLYLLRMKYISNSFKMIVKKTPVSTFYLDKKILSEMSDFYFISVLANRMLYIFDQRREYKTFPISMNKKSFREVDYVSINTLNSLTFEELSILNFIVEKHIEKNGYK